MNLISEERLESNSIKKNFNHLRSFHLQICLKIIAIELLKLLASRELPQTNLSVIVLLDEVYEAKGHNSKYLQEVTHL